MCSNTTELILQESVCTYNYVIFLENILKCPNLLFVILVYKVFRHKNDLKFIVWVNFVTLNTL